MHRWTARFLVAVMLVPAFGRLALAGTGASTAMSCHRQPLQETPSAAAHAMHCHGMGSTPRPETSSDSIYADHSCCENCDCCCRLKTSEWARPAVPQLSFVNLVIEAALASTIAARDSAEAIAPNSARAPPRA